MLASDARSLHAQLYVTVNISNGYSERSSGYSEKVVVTVKKVMVTLNGVMVTVKKK